MQRPHVWLTLAMTAVVLGFSSVALADDYANTIAVFKKSPAVQPFFTNAYGYAIFPKVGKGGFGIGGSYGKGKVYRQGTLTGTAQMIEASIGFQAGGQVFSQMIFFQDKRAYDEFTSGDFAFDATASAVAITAGAQAQVLGVYDLNLTEPLAKVLKNLGSKHVFVVHGKDGLDEITTTTDTQISELANGKERTYR